MIPLFRHKVKGVGQKSCKNYFALRSLNFGCAARNLIWKIFMENFHKNIFDKTIDKSIY